MLVRGKLRVVVLQGFACVALLFECVGQAGCISVLLMPVFRCADCQVNRIAKLLLLLLLGLGTINIGSSVVESVSASVGPLRLRISSLLACSIFAAVPTSLLRSVVLSPEYHLLPTQHRIELLNLFKLTRMAIMLITCRLRLKHGSLLPWRHLGGLLCLSCRDSYYCILIISFS